MADDINEVRAIIDSVLYAEKEFEEARERFSYNLDMAKVAKSGDTGCAWNTRTYYLRCARAAYGVMVASANLRNAYLNSLTVRPF